MSAIEVNETPIPPKDTRFPSTNQYLNCWNKYNEWMLCLKKNEKDESKCYLPRHFMKEICPAEAVEKWDADRDEDKFAGLQLEEPAAGHH